MDLRSKQRAVVDALEDIKGRDIVVYNTAAMPSMFERVVIASGESTRQVKSLADNVQDKLEALGARVYGVEGGANGEWVLVDLGDIVVHIMHPTIRDFYNLEEVWGEKPVRMSAPAKALPKATKKSAPKKTAKKPAKTAKSGKPGKTSKTTKTTKTAKPKKSTRAAASNKKKSANKPTARAKAPRRRSQR
jgi:ribosome-associated protein